MLDYRGARGGWLFANPINCAFTLNTQSPQARGLVGWWPLGAGQWGMVRDVLGCWHMTATNGPTRVASAQGLCTLFVDESLQYMTRSESVVTSFPFTLTTWINPDETKGQSIISLADSSVSNVYHFLYCNSGTIWAATYNGGWAVAAATASAPLNQWTYCTAVFAAANDRRAYVNGGNRGNQAASRAFGNIDQTRIGARAGSAAQQHFSGMLRDCRIYSRALSDAEVLAKYLNPWELYGPVLPLPYSYLETAGLSIPLLMSLLRRRRVA